MPLTDLSREELVRMIETLRAELTATQHVVTQFSAENQNLREVLARASDMIYDYVEIDPNNEQGLQRYDSLTSEIERVLK